MRRVKNVFTIGGPVIIIGEDESGQVAERKPTTQPGQYPVFEDKYEAPKKVKSTGLESLLELGAFSGLGSTSIEVDDYKLESGHGRSEITFRKMTDSVASQIWANYQSQVAYPESVNGADARTCLNQAIETLNRDFNAGIKLDGNAPITLTAKKLQSHVRKLVLSDATRARSFEIVRGTHNQKLDSVARAVNQALFNAYQDALKAGDLENAWDALEPLLATTAAKPAVLELVSTHAGQDVQKALAVLEKADCGLESGPETQALCEKIAATRSVGDLEVLVGGIDCEKSRGALAQGFTEMFLSRRNATTAFQFAQLITSRSDQEKALSACADLKWEENDADARNSAVQMIKTADYASTKNDWFSAKASELWVSDHDAAIKMIERVSYDSTKNDWYKDRANELWFGGKRDSAAEMVARISYSSTKDDWYLEKANNLWIKGDKDAARELAGKIESQSKLGGWFKTHLK